ncbi:MAG TPA: BTAD domain-containing putative transcriptional regulator [Fimbriimonadaceae bacterium]|jgi:predicted ATPase/DNA-binding SARP family transcriptional activator
MLGERSSGSDWTIHLFGRLRVTGRGLILNQFETKRANYLLARLAICHSSSLTRGEAADFLWPEDLFDATRLRLRQELVRLRRGLGEARDILQADSEWIRLARESVRVDLEYFSKVFQEAQQTKDPTTRERLCEQALSLSQYDFLADYNEDWIEIERFRIAEQRYQLLLELATLQSNRGDHEAALGSAKMAVAINSLREEGHLLAMQELKTLGHVTDALVEFQNFEKTLKEELNEAPSEEIHQAANALHQIPAHQNPEPRPVGPGLTFSIPAPAEPIYGREELIGHLCTLLDPETAGHRLVTLTGPGGIGKTRLSIQTALLLKDVYNGRAGWVSLVDSDDQSNIPIDIATALGIELRGSADPLERVCTLISKQPSLLVLDNFEQLLPEGADYILTLASRCDNLKLLITSRVPLKLTGERVIAVGPLPMPDEGDWMAQPSMRIFLDPLLAEQVVKDPSPADLSLYREIVERLEGIPLALQLASGRLRSVSANDLIGQLGKRLDIVNPKYDAPKRHRTIRTAIEGSFEALPPDLQKAMGRLSVFRGGWNQAAAAFVCELEEPLPILERLLDSSLIRVDREEAGLRFRMLETIREYVLSVVPNDELEKAHIKHSDWIIELGALGNWRRMNGEDLKYLKIYDPEADNLREAARYCLDHDLDRAIKIGVAFGRYWSNRSLIKEALQFYKTLFERVDLTAVTPDLAKASFWQSALLYIAHGFAPGQMGTAVCARTAELCRQTGLEAELALCSLHEARGHHMAGNPDLSLQKTFECEKRLRELGDMTDVALALENAAMLYYYRGKPEDAISGIEEARSLVGGTDAPFHQVQTAMMVAFMYFEVNDLKNAKAQAYRALELAESFEFLQFVPMIQEICGKVAQEEGQWDLAADWYRTAANNWDFYGDLGQYADQLQLLARIHLLKNEPAEAFPLLSNALELFFRRGMANAAPCALVATARAYVQVGKLELAARIIGAYKNNDKPHRFINLATEIAYVDAIIADLGDALGKDELARIVSTAPSLEDAYRVAFPSLKLNLN